MHKLQLKLILLIFCIIVNKYSFALTEHEFIQKVLQHNKYLKKDQIYVNIKQIELQSSKQNYEDWNLNINAELDNSYYDNDKSTTSNSAYQKNKIENEQSIEFSAEKKFLNSPGSFEFNAKRGVPEDNIIRYRQDGIYDNYTINNFDTSYKFSYKYPLLKYDSNATSLKTYHRNILDLEREELDFLDAKEGFLVDRLKEYLLWASYRQKEIIYNIYLEKIQGIKLYNTKNKIILTSAIYRANADLSGNNSKLQAQKKSLAVTLNDNNLLVAKPVINHQKHTKIITKNLINYLANNNRALLKMDIDKQLKQTDIDYYQNQNLPQLDVTFSADKSFNKGNTLTTEYNNKSITYTSNITFNMPLGSDIGNQANLDIAELTLQKLDIDYQDKLQDIRSDVEALNTELKLNKQTLVQYPNIIKIEVENTNLQKQYYANGKNKLKDLIDAYKDSRDVNLEYIDYIISYQQNILEYNDLLDRLIN